MILLFQLAVVETMYSLGAIGQRADQVAVIDRLERVALNALPAALTADMWSHNCAHVATPKPTAPLCAALLYQWCCALSFV